MSHVTAAHRVVDAIPGTSPEAFDLQVFGYVGEWTRSRPHRARYPIVAVRMPVAALRAHRRIGGLPAEVEAWWRAEVRRPSRTAAEARRLLEIAAGRIAEITQAHTVNTMVAQFLYQQFHALASRAGRAELVNTALTSGRNAETRTVSDLWALAHGDTERETFLARHGFHGPSEGELSSRSWREDVTPIDRLVERYRGRRADESPDHAQRERELRARAAVDDLDLVAGPLDRCLLRILTPTTRHYLELRERGRVTFLKAIDVARFAARELGRHLTGDGSLGDPEDVFYLTTQELTEQHGDYRPLVAARRAQRQGHRATRLPRPGPVTSSRSRTASPSRHRSSTGSPPVPASPRRPPA